MLHSLRNRPRPALLFYLSNIFKISARALNGSLIKSDISFFWFSCFFSSFITCTLMDKNFSCSIYNMKLCHTRNFGNVSALHAKIIYWQFRCRMFLKGSCIFKGEDFGRWLDYKSTRFCLLLKGELGPEWIGHRGHEKEECMFILVSLL